MSTREGRTGQTAAGPGLTRGEASEKRPNVDWYSRLVGHPWVFEHVRPLIVGGIDMSPAYQRLKCDRASSVLDVGCGSGDALRYLPEFASYLGVDTDPTAIKLAASRYGSRANVKFECRTATAEDFAALAPTHAV